MKSNKIFAAVIAVIAFYFIGIVFNSVILRLAFSVDATQVPVWSGYGFLALLIAGLTGIGCAKAYKYLSTRED